MCLWAPVVHCGRVNDLQGQQELALSCMLQSCINLPVKHKPSAYLV